MIFFYSGEGTDQNPELIFKDRSNMMMSHWYVYSKTKNHLIRFSELLQARKDELGQGDDRGE